MIAYTFSINTIQNVQSLSAGIHCRQNEKGFYIYLYNVLAFQIALSRTAHPQLFELKGGKPQNQWYCAIRIGQSES